MENTYDVTALKPEAIAARQKGPQNRITWGHVTPNKPFPVARDDVIELNERWYSTGLYAHKLYAIV